MKYLDSVTRSIASAVGLLLLSHVALQHVSAQTGSDYCEIWNATSPKGMYVQSFCFDGNDIINLNPDTRCAHVQVWYKDGLYTGDVGVVQPFAPEPNEGWIQMCTGSVYVEPTPNETKIPVELCTPHILEPDSTRAYFINARACDNDQALSLMRPETFPADLVIFQPDTDYTRSESQCTAAGSLPEGNPPPPDTASPSKSPTRGPTASPTKYPTGSPSSAPTRAPIIGTRHPTQSPAPSHRPVVAVDDTATTPYQTPVDIDIINNDNGHSLSTPEILSTPSHGTVTYTDNKAVYSPAPLYEGTDSFTYKVCDQSDPTNCDIATVTIQVLPLASASPTLSPSSSPSADLVAVDDAVTTPYETPITIDIANNDQGHEILINQATVTENPTSGTVIIDASGKAVYTPNDGFVGEDTFVYQTCDSGGQCDTATVTVTVNPPGVTAMDDNYNNDGSTTILPVLENDVIGELNNITILDGPVGAKVLPDGTIEYTPNPGHEGPDPITYQICDNFDNCATAIATVNVTPPPIMATADSAISDGSPVEIDILNNDSSGSGLKPNTVEVISGPSSGLATIDPDTGIVTYTPNTGYEGTDTFEYKVCDNYGLCTTSTVVVTVLRDATNAPTMAPIIANDDTYELSWTDTDITMPILGNDGVATADPRIDPASLEIVGGPIEGVTITDGFLTYTPPDGPRSEDTITFQYQVCGKLVLGLQDVCAIATVTINVRATPTAAPTQAQPPSVSPAPSTAPSIKASNAPSVSPAPTISPAPTTPKPTRGPTTARPTTAERLYIDITAGEGGIIDGGPVRLAGYTEATEDVNVGDTRTYFFFPQICLSQEGGTGMLHGHFDSDFAIYDPCYVDGLWEQDPGNNNACPPSSSYPNEDYPNWPLDVYTDYTVPGTGNFYQVGGDGISGTDAHDHQYDDTCDCVYVDYFFPSKTNYIVHDPTAMVSDPAVEGRTLVDPDKYFKIVIVNPDINRAGFIAINDQFYTEGDPYSYTPVSVHADIPFEDLQVYSFGNYDDPNVEQLYSLQMGYHRDAIERGKFGILPTATGSLGSNNAGLYGEWRNGALTMQFVEVDVDGNFVGELEPEWSNTTCKSPSYTTGEGYYQGCQGPVKRGALLYETTLFWHELDTYDDTGWTATYNEYFATVASDATVDGTVCVVQELCYVIVDGVSVGDVGVYTFKDIQQNHTIEAVFAPYAANGDSTCVDWSFAPSASPQPSVSPAPSISPPPTMAPTVSHQPSISQAPSGSPSTAFEAELSVVYSQCYRWAYEFPCHADNPSFDGGECGHIADASSAFDPNCVRENSADPYSNCLNKDNQNVTNLSPSDASNNCCPLNMATDFENNEAGNRFEYLQDVPESCVNINFRYDGGYIADGQCFPGSLDPAIWDVNNSGKMIPSTNPINMPKSINEVNPYNSYAIELSINPDSACGHCYLTGLELLGGKSQVYTDANDVDQLAGCGLREGADDPNVPDYNGWEGSVKTSGSMLYKNFTFVMKDGVQTIPSLASTYVWCGEIWHYEKAETDGVFDWDYEKPLDPPMGGQESADISKPSCAVETGYIDGDAYIEFG